MAMDSSSGSVVRRILLGSQLRRLREERGITRDAAGYAIRASESKISRMELGRVSFKTRDVEDLLTLYGVTDEREREALVGLVRQANVAGWWHSYSDVLPGWFPTYVGLESAATAIDAYEVQFVHGLLQTEEYAHAVITAGQPDAPRAELERRVGVRLERQKRLVAEDAPEFKVVLDEASIARPYGGREVMRRQLRHLIDLSHMPNVTVQLVPFSYGGHAAESGAFTVLGFSESDLPDVAYVEHLTSALYLDKPEDVGKYRAAIGRLQRVAQNPEETRQLLAGIAQQL
ncbi:helix-turn-helix domain-containing protein [Streptomyces sp. A7024]|uniref:Helix-turn-helix domain-containing protein n=1 Tax=Streptomyces coryli TaxID=1128680 RepID=A0A6G4TYQ8_9ACTN|nr:Scr1 family TA system antitoxin-like transcriptional regulator [Streptomyces coryli]NGN64131.1 helix-turn-helix domain-containing protein [Streptomyces coryli]